MVGQAGDRAFVEGSEGGVARLDAGLLVDDPEDRGERQARRVGRGPSGERLGDRIQRRDPPFGVGDDDGVADALEGDPHPLALAGGLLGVGLGASSGLAQHPAEQRHARRGDQVQGESDLVVGALDPEPIAGWQEEPRRGDRAEPGGQQGRATAGEAGDDQDRREQRGERKQDAERRVEGPAGDRPQGHGDDRASVAEQRRARGIWHGRHPGRRPRLGRAEGIQSVEIPGGTRSIILSKSGLEMRRAFPIRPAIRFLQTDAAGPKLRFSASGRPGRLPRQRPAA